MNKNMLWGLLAGLGALVGCGDDTGGSGGSGGTPSAGGESAGGAGGGETNGLETSHGGMDLGQWMALYWTWNLGGDQEPTVGDRTFLPLPVGTDEDGDMVFTGELDFELPAGQGFVLPMFVWIGETYEGGDPPDDDPSMPTEATFLATELVLTLDGTDILNTAGLGDYYFDATDFAETVVYEQPTDYGAVGALWVKGVGVLHAPLASGAHVLHLEEFNDDLGAGFSNTWNITVP